MDKEVLTIVSTIAATLRVAAEWPGDYQGEMLETANLVETNFDDVCCPLCEEVRCDEGCPLEQVRGER
jgi:hypothetical protein